MKILVINGSPKGERSNTLRLTNAFLEGFLLGQEGNHPNIRRREIAGMEIRPCLGCFSCWKRTPGKCCIPDEMQSILEDILWADVTIWSFPLYYFSLPGKMKTVMDRQLPLTLPFMVSNAEGGGHPARYDMSGKKTVLISTCGFYTAKSNYDSVTAQFDRICGKGNYTTLFCGEGELFGVPELSGRINEYLAVVRQAGREYADGGILADTAEKLEQLLFPREVFERMADASWGITETGEKEDVSLTFTRQMAALYHPEAYNGRDLLLDMDYTDIGKKYRIILGKTGSRVVEDFDEKPTTVIHTPFSVWQAIASGELEGAEALMKHLYRVEGDFTLMLRWDDFFGQNSGRNAEKEELPAAEKSDMRYLLTPWVVFWVAANVHEFWGSAVSLIVCSLLPVVFFRNKKTVYDVISGVFVSVFAIFLISGWPLDLVIPLSYLGFGLMWGVSALRKIPLSAEYSRNDYGGESALRNPIFMKTNRILTAGWGILYCILPVLWWFAGFGVAKSVVKILSYILPAMMGVFTVWFQKWYPARVARGKRADRPEK